MHVDNKALQERLMREGMGRGNGQQPPRGPGGPQPQPQRRPEPSYDDYGVPPRSAAPVDPPPGFGGSMGVQAGARGGFGGGRAAAQEKGWPWDELFVGLMQLLVGGIIYPIAGFYAVRGIFSLINTVLSFIRFIPGAVRIPVDTMHWVFYLIGFLIPFLVSRTEWHWPIVWVLNKRGKTVWKFAAFNVVMIWLVVFAFDIIASFNGVRNPPADSPGIWLWIGSSTVASGAISPVLCIFPEWMIKRGAGRVAMFRNAVRADQG